MSIALRLAQSPPYTALACLMHFNVMCGKSSANSQVAWSIQHVCMYVMTLITQHIWRMQHVIPHILGWDEVMTQSPTIVPGSAAATQAPF